MANWLISPVWASMVPSTFENDPMSTPIWSVFSATADSILPEAATVSAVRLTVKPKSQMTKPPAAIRSPVKTRSAWLQSGVAAGSCNTFVASSSPSIAFLSYNICASNQSTGIIDVSSRQPRYTDHLRPQSDENWHRFRGDIPGRSGRDEDDRAGDQALANETKKEPNSTGSKQSGISPCFHAPGILASRNPGSPPQRRRRSSSLKTRQWSA